LRIIRSSSSLTLHIICVNIISYIVKPSALAILLSRLLLLATISCVQASLFPATHLTNLLTKSDLRHLNSHSRITTCGHKR